MIGNAQKKAHYLNLKPPPIDELMFHYKYDT